MTRVAVFMLVAITGCAASDTGGDGSGKSDQSDQDAIELENGVPHRHQFRKGEQTLFKFTVPEGQTFLHVESQRDPFLYLKHGEPPTKDDFEYHGVTREPEIEPPAVAGTWFLMVDNDRLELDDVDGNITVTWNATDEGPFVLDKGVPLELSASNKRFSAKAAIAVPPGATNLRFVVETNGRTPVLCAGLGEAVTVRDELGVPSTPDWPQNVGSNHAGAVRCGDNVDDVHVNQAIQAFPHDSEGHWRLLVDDVLNANVTVTATYDEGQIKPIALRADESKSFSSATCEPAYYRIHVPAATSELTVTGIFEEQFTRKQVFLRHGEIPVGWTFGHVDSLVIRPEGPFDREVHTIENPEAGEWFVRVAADTINQATKFEPGVDRLECGAGMTGTITATVK
jgi:hypothetical protein